jgi:hypothetical protein
LTYTPRHIKDEIQLCQRTVEKTYDIDVTPGTTTAVGQLTARYSSAETDNAVLMNWDFKVTKRIAPVVSTYNPTGGGANSMRADSGVDVTSSTSSLIGQRGCVITNTAANVANTPHRVHAIAICDL